MSRLMLMGPRGNEQWVPVPAFNADFSKVGFSAGSEYINGGASQRNSAASHKVYNMAWNLAKRDTLRPVTDLSDGVFSDSPTDLIYFTEPMAMDKNCLPQQWAFPAQAAFDAPILNGRKRPLTVPTPANPHSYPRRSATYRVVEGAPRKKLYLPITPGHTAWVGVHGLAESGTAGVYVTPTRRGIPAALSHILPMMGVMEDVRMNMSYSGAEYDGIELEIAGAGSVTLTGLMVQMLPFGVTPEPGGFISGQGNSGCQFRGKPAQTAYSAKLDRVGMSAVLVEVGDWL